MGDLPNYMRGPGFLQIGDREPVSLFCLADIAGNRDPEMIAATPAGIVALDYIENRTLWRTQRPLQGRSVLTSYELPMAADINADGIQEIIAIEVRDDAGKSQDLITVLNGRDGHELMSRRSGGSILGIAAGDLDGDGNWEIAYTLAKQDGEFPLVVIDCRSGEQRWKRTLSGHNYSRPLIADVNDDQKMEIVLLAHYYPETKENLFCFDAEGNILWTFRLAGMSYSSPMARDFLKNGGVQIAVGGSSEYYLLDGRSGRPLWRYRTGALAGHIFDLWEAGIGDLNGDGSEDIAFTAGGILHALDGRTGQRIWQYSPALPGDYIAGNVLICDMDGDGINEVVSGFNSEYYKCLSVVNNEGHLITNDVIPSAPASGRFFNFLFDKERKRLLYFAGNNNETLQVLALENARKPGITVPTKRTCSLLPTLKKKRVRSSEAQSCNPAWSPDGKRLAFQAFSHPRLYSEDKREKINDVRLDIYDLEKGTIVSHDLGEKGQILSSVYPQWNFSEKHIGLQINASDFHEISRTLGILDLNGGEIRTIWRGPNLYFMLKPVWSGKGDAYLPAFDGSLSRCADFSGEKIEEIIPPHQGGYAFVLSPSEDDFCYVSPAENFSVLLSSRDGRLIRTIADHLSTFPHPSWFHDGTRIAYCHKKGGKTSIRGFDLATGLESDLVQDDYDNYAPVCSPTENKLVYCSRRGDGYFVMLADFDGGSLSVLSRCSILDPLFVWSPDGNHLAFTDRENGVLHVFLLDLSQLPGLSGNVPK